jgi:putative YhdH/YhfP family quinone oxidoreductase
MKAFLVSEVDGVLNCGVEEVEPVAKEPTDILVQLDYSGVNFKDALVAAPRSRVRRLARLVGGVDGAGVVVASLDPALAVGARVAVHGSDLGVGRDGGFAQFVYAPSKSVNVLDEALSTRDAMIIGTAGFAAMESVLALEAHGLERDGEVLVTGATGGVGSLAVTFLAAMGYRPVASTGSTNDEHWLEERGATRVIARDEISDRPDRVLGSERWSGAIDCIGGDTLHQILRSLRYGGAVAASGLVAGTDLATTIYPFITRAVSLLGIDSVETTSVTRSRVWAALAQIAPTVDFDPLVDHVVTLDELPEALESIRNGETRGRILVNPTPG